MVLQKVVEGFLGQCLNGRPRWRIGNPGLGGKELSLVGPGRRQESLISDRMLLVCSAVFLPFGLSATIPARLART
jgi:hypothetical protein